MSSGYFEVHVSEEIFQTLNICQKNEIIIGLSCNKTTGNTCYHRFNWYTCRHKGKA